MSGLRLDGRVAAVTGAGRGIGRAYALLLGQLGAKVVVNDLGGSTLGTGGDAGPADEVVKQIEEAGGAAVANYADVSTVEGGKSVIDTAVEHFGGIDIVVNNAGNMVWGSLPEATIETIDAHWKVHVQRLVQHPARGLAVLPREELRPRHPHHLDRHVRADGQHRLRDRQGVHDRHGQEPDRGQERRQHQRQLHRAQRDDPDIRPHRRRAGAGGCRRRSRFPPMDPVNVAPMVAYLAHESCQVSGETYLAGGGRFARLFVGVTDGYLQPGLTGATIDDVAANWAAINDEAGYYVPANLMDCVGHYMSHLRG